MKHPSIKQKAAQSGFTLIELVIVIVIIGILAAVAIPNIANTSDQARLATQQATLGALKGAWGSQFAALGHAPTCAQVAAGIADPTCSGTGPITCTGIRNKADTAAASFTCTETAGVVSSPAALVCAATGC